MSVQTAEAPAAPALAPLPPEAFARPAFVEKASSAPGDRHIAALHAPAKPTA